MAEPVEAFKNAFKIPELRSRLIFTLFMLVLFRLGAFVPVPGVDGSALVDMLGRSGGGLLGFYDMFTGGAFSRATVFALGIMPYITASIILSLLIPVIPSLEALQKTGAEGQRKINEYTRYGTIALCIVQSVPISIYLQSLGREVVPNPGPLFIALSVITLTTGTAFLMWIGEQISEHGIGNGISLLIFIGIVADLPNAVRNAGRMIANDQMSVFVGLALVFIMVMVTAGAIVVTTGQRRIPVQYPRQIKGRGMTGGTRTYLPLRVNHAGVIPIIFASSILMLPGSIASQMKIAAIESTVNWLFNPYGLPYNLMYAGLIVFFSFFYTAITFNPVEMADNLKKYGGVIVGVRPGKATADYLNAVMVRITTSGSLFLAAVALVPMAIFAVLDVQDFNLIHFFGGTTLLILVGVGLDTIKQIEQHLIMRHYEGFSSGRGKIRARR
ncbi:MAG TPA: preprotein translocase subunit SecY [Candidatus Hydrogenedentes bacterium]|nr:preprotein translocase subunit SecY [Candidatus Hydrogenedentota bacterium]HQL93130.1 preprotein translocase subunit SecY [Candidatus Hydrogenedentota bacterium]